MPRLRRSLLALVLINEAEIQSEGDREAGLEPVLQGETFMHMNEGMWHGYLAYNEVEFREWQKKKGAPKDTKDNKKKK
ncbi:hypothetical protein B484DRAFT_423519 [Ochromonadaceae sp. CCMP2298]|nr:hypothetical protein B484DRAFT_423519 [Ochromonadaceae sp. CCMP2298]